MRQSSANRNKSHDHSKIKKEEQIMYVPAIEEKSFNNEPSRSESKLFQMKFEFDQKQKTVSEVHGFNVQERNITFSNVQIPQFPDPPNPNITVEEMAELIRKICTALDIEF